jgi:hypothetical protein
MVVVFRATMHHREASPMAQTISVRGIDLATLVFHVVGLDDSGQVVVGPENPNQLKCLAFVPVMITLEQPIFP